MFTYIYISLIKIYKKIEEHIEYVAISRYIIVNVKLVLVYSSYINFYQAFPSCFQQESWSE